MWSLGFLPLVSGPLAREIQPSASASGYFRYGYERLDSLVPPVLLALRSAERSSGRLLFGGRKESFPQLGLLLVPSESALRTTPFLVFISVRGGNFREHAFDAGRRSSLSRGRQRK